MMRRIVSLLLFICLAGTIGGAWAEQASQIAAGDLVQFGRYEQDGNADNGMEPLSWRVLAVEDGAALLITASIIESRAYHNRYAVTAWESSSLRAWLNSSFAEAAFTETERRSIRETSVSNRSTQGFWSTDAGADSLDGIFLLSYAELLHYLPDASQRQSAHGTWALLQQADAKGQQLSGIPGGVWWLRSPGSVGWYAMTVEADGTVGGNIVTNRAIGVRPAVWVALDALSSSVPQ